MELLVPIAILAVMYAVLIMPQQRRVKEHRAYVASIQVGDDVVTTSGLFGTVTALDDDRARLRIAPDVEITLARMAVARPQSAVAPADPP
ncbi:MAG TPA: preprotein translocase subunit YajC, partial [Acidimicrobiales bacterium]